MPVFDIFSRRKRTQSATQPDVYQYTEVPKSLRVQIVHILKDALGVDVVNGRADTAIYQACVDILRREYGVFSLDVLVRARGSSDPEEELLNFFINSDNFDSVIDVIEICFRMINGHIRNSNSYSVNCRPRISPDAAIEELNVRLRDHCLGYEFCSGEIVRVDSLLIHREAVIPALRLLTDPAFKGANDEFLSAFEHYRHGRNKECLIDACKSLESALKIVCERKGVRLSGRETASKLIQAAIDQDVIPKALSSNFAALRSVLESGVPTLRNGLAGHGQGAAPVQVPGYFCSFALTTTASAIVFLVEAAKN